MAATTSPLIVWDDRFSLGIREIDSQHKKLVAMINGLHEAMSQGRGKHAIDGILSALADYTVEHFAAEERLLEQTGYPGLNDHQYKHRRLTEKVRNLRRELQAGNSQLSIETMEFLKYWLTRHILITDKQYAAFLKSKGVS